MTLKIPHICAAGIFAAGLIAVPAWAADDDDVRKAVECMPAKDIVKILSRFDKMDADKRDTVDAFIAAKFNVEGDQKLPDRMFMRSDGIETALTMTDDGTVTDFDRIGAMPKDGEVCVEDQARAGLSRKEDGLSFGIDFDVKFKNASGRYSLEELRDGAKDGKSFYKKLVPAPIRLLVPKMTHVSVSFDDPEAPGQTIKALSGETRLEGLIIEPFGGTRVIEIDHLESLGADTLVISGGPFILEPSPSIEKMRKLGFSEKEDEEGDDENDTDKEDETQND